MFSSGKGATVASNNGLPFAVAKRRTFTRVSPSIRILVVPPVSRVTCCRRPTTPMRCRSAAVGVCTSAERWVTISSSLDPPPPVASATAASEPARPISRGMATWGNRTTSRSGRTGRRSRGRVVPIVGARRGLRLPSSVAWGRFREAVHRRAAPTLPSP